MNTISLSPNAQKVIDAALDAAVFAVALADLVSTLNTGNATPLLQRLARFVADHGMLHGMTDRAVIIGVECVDMNTREVWTEYSSVWTFGGARQVLGY